MGRGLVWPFGKETWCNLEGRYLHLVGDFSQTLADTPGDNDTVAICQLGVFGTKYIRYTAALEKVEIYTGESTTIYIEHITSYYEIGNDLAINLR